MTVCRNICQYTTVYVFIVNEVLSAPALACLTVADPVLAKGLLEDFENLRWPGNLHLCDAGL